VEDDRTGFDLALGDRGGTGVERGRRLAQRLQALGTKNRDDGRTAGDDWVGIEVALGERAGSVVGYPLEHRGKEDVVKDDRAGFQPATGERG
jgi:hypothetical protein